MLETFFQMFDKPLFGRIRKFFEYKTVKTGSDATAITQKTTEILDQTRSCNHCNYRLECDIPIKNLLLLPTTICCDCKVFRMHVSWDGNSFTSSETSPLFITIRTQIYLFIFASRNLRLVSVLYETYSLLFFLSHSLIQYSLCMPAVSFNTLLSDTHSGSIHFFLQNWRISFGTEYIRFHAESG